MLAKSDAENSSETGGNAITESITMFNVIFALVTTKAMNRAIPNFLYKCQSKYFSTPGTDPVASAMGLRHDLFGICCTVLRK